MTNLTILFRERSILKLPILQKAKVTWLKYWFWRNEKLTYGSSKNHAQERSSHLDWSRRSSGDINSITKTFEILRLIDPLWGLPRKFNGWTVSNYVRFYFFKIIEDTSFKIYILYYICQWYEENWRWTIRTKLWFTVLWLSLIKSLRKSCFTAKNQSINHFW